jgi:NAD(P)-dependent dehydrogenase (short-subunit alcohol dehydrogenase family)
MTSRVAQAYDLSGRSAIITGGGTGIGKATAVLLGSLGAKLTLTGRKVGPLEEVVATINSAGGEAHAVPGDVTDPDSVIALTDGHLDRFGGCDILVNNAGGSYLRNVEDWDVAGWDNMINLNLRGVWLTCQRIGPAMAKGGGGSIVNVSSYAVVNSMLEVAPYSAAKAGVEHLTEVLASTWGADGVRVNCVRVGSILSEGYVRALVKAGRDPDAVGGMGAEKNALTRAGQPEEVAMAIAFLVSGASSYVTGAVLACNGGREPYRPPT